MHPAPTSELASPCKRGESQRYATGKSAASVAEYALGSKSGEEDLMDVVLADTDSLWLLRKVRSEKDLGLVATDEAPLAPTVRASNLPAIVGALPQDFRVIAHRHRSS